MDVSISTIEAGVAFKLNATLLEVGQFAWCGQRAVRSSLPGSQYLRTLGFQDCRV